MDNVLVHSALVAIPKILKVQCMVNGTQKTDQLDDVYLKNSDHVLSFAEIKSSCFNGILGLMFGHDQLLKLMDSMLMGTASELSSDEIISGTSEILNMVYGEAKSHLSKTGETFEMVIPQSYVSKDIPQKFYENYKFQSVPFDSDIGDFKFLIGL